MSDDSENNVFSIFEHYASKKAKNQGSGKNKTNDEYHAFAIESAKEKQTYLRFHRADGAIILMPYATVRFVMCVPSEWIAIQFDYSVIEMEGQNLTPLVKLLQDEQLSAVYCFREDYHLMPAPDKPIVRILQHETFKQRAENTSQPRKE